METLSALISLVTSLVLIAIVTRDSRMIHRMLDGNGQRRSAELVQARRAASKAFAARLAAMTPEQRQARTERVRARALAKLAELGVTTALPAEAAQ